MKLYPNQLANHLSQQLPKISWLSGDEPLQLLEAADAIRAAARKRGLEERQVFDVDAHFNWQSLLQAGASMSLFGSSKLIEVRLATNKLGREGGEVIRKICADLANSPDIYLLTSPKLEASQTRSAWYKALDQAGIVMQVWPLAANQLAGWINNRATSEGLQLQPDAIKFLAEKVEGNLLAADQEIKKLALFAAEEESKKITQEEVISLTQDSSRYNLFDLSDACLAGQARRSVKILQGLQGEGTENTLLLWVITREIRQLYHLLYLLNQGTYPNQAYKQLGIWQNKQSIYAQASKRLNLMQLTQLLHLAQQADLSIKTSSAEINSQLLELVIKLSQ